MHCCCCNKAVQQCKWLDEVQSNLKPGTLSSIDVNVVRRLIQTGVGIVSHPSCERAMSELQQLLTASDTCEQKAIKCLKARSETIPTSLVHCLDNWQNYRFNSEISLGLYMSGAYLLRPP